MARFPWLQTGADRLITRRFAGAKSHHEQLEKPLVIAHLTDQHFGPATPHELQLEAVRRVNAAKPDLVVLTGDYVAHSLAHLDEIEEVLSGLHGPALAVLGNHDHWTGPKEVRRALERSNIEVLENAWTERTYRGQKIQIVGVDDAFTAHADSEKATKGLIRGVPTLGLSHVGEEADALWHSGVPLVLSGHTHSGQIAMGSMHRVLMGHFAGHRYVHGLYGQREGADEGALYVSAGIGSSRFGLRLGERARPEVALFDLGLAPGSLDEPDVEQAPIHGRVVSEKTLKRRHKDALKKQRARLAEHRRAFRERFGMDPEDYDL